MPTKLHATFAAISVASLFVSQHACAQDAAILAPYLGERTVGVVRVDLQKLDVNKVTSWYVDAVKRAGAPQDLVDDLSARMPMGAGMLQAMIGQAQNVGVQRLLIVINLDQQDQPRVIVIAPSPGKLDEAKAMAEGFRMTVLSANKNLVVTDPRYAKEFAQAKVVARDDLTQAIAGDNAAAVVVSAGMHESLRQRLRTDHPNMQTPDGPVESGVLLDGMRHVQAQLVIAPTLGLKYTITASDADAATKLKKLIDDGGKNRKADTQTWSDLIDLASPAQKGKELVVDLKQADLDKLVKTLVPSMIQAQVATKRIKSATNMRQLSIAIQMYVVENDGVAPTGFADLEKYLGGTPGLQNLTTNPLQPARAGKGYIYLPAPGGRIATIKNTASRIALYEDGDFGNGINVAYWDGHVEFVPDKALFEKQLAEALGK